MTRSTVSLKDRDILRRLGAELAEAAADPVNEERRKASYGLGLRSCWRGVLCSKKRCVAAEASSVAEIGRATTLICGRQYAQLNHQTLAAV